MRQSGSFGRKFSASYRQLSDGERVASFMRALYAERTAANISADTVGKIAAKTIEKWLERSSAPSFAHTLILISVYGPEFICACMDSPPLWVAEAGRAQARARLEARRAEITRQIEGMG